MNLHTGPRRNFLRGLTLSLGGAIYLSPILRSLAMGAEGIEPKMPRFLFVLEGNGLPPQQIHPLNLPFIVRNERKSLQTFKLDGAQFPNSLKPVAEYADRMVVLQGINGEVCGGGHSTSHGALGAYNTRDGKVVHGITVDCLLGGKSGTVFDNVILGISSEGRDVVFNCSAYGANQSAATFCNPLSAHQRIFGPLVGSDVTRRQSILLDYLKDDIRKARSHLSGAEKGKLDAYLEAYDSIGIRNAYIQDAAGGEASNVLKTDARFTSELPEERLDAHFELATATLISGLTNVATIASGVGFRHFNIQFSKLASQAKHPMGHGVIGGNKTAIADAEAIRAYHFSLIARTMQKLAAMPEGNGTMLDNTVIVYFSDAANSHHTKCEEWPMVLLGGSPRLKIDGRYVVYPYRGQAGWRTVNTIHNSLLHAAGLPSDNFGHHMKGVDDIVQKGPLTEICA
jgi:Protein of unknown function (DUF1552)